MVNLMYKEKVEVVHCNKLTEANFKDLLFDFNADSQKYIIGTKQTLEDYFSLDVQPGEITGGSIPVPPGIFNNVPTTANRALHIV